MPDQTIRLYQGRTSTASWRVRIALAIKGIVYESVWIDVRGGENLGDDYRAIAPTQQVPCVEINGLRLVQSVAIIEYLEETHPDPPLLPQRAEDRAVVRQLTQIVNSLIQPLQNSGLARQLQSQFGADDASVLRWRQYWLQRHLASLESIMKSCAGRCCFGDTVTMADVFLLPQIERAADFGIDITQYPTIARVVEHLRNIGAFAGSYPGRV